MEEKDTTVLNQYYITLVVAGCVSFVVTIVFFIFCAVVCCERYRNKIQNLIDFVILCVSPIGTLQKKIIQDPKKNTHQSLLIYHDRIIPAGKTFQQLICVIIVLVIAVSSVFFGVTGASFEVEDECPYSSHYTNENDWKCFKGRTLTEYNCSAAIHRRHREKNIKCIRWNFSFMNTLVVCFTLYQFVFYSLRVHEAIYNTVDFASCKWSCLMVIGAFLASCGLHVGMFCFLFFSEDVNMYHEIRYKYSYSIPIGLPILIALFSRKIGAFFPEGTKKDQKYNSCSWCWTTRVIESNMDTAAYEQDVAIDDNDIIGDTYNSTGLMALENPQEMMQTL